jgi:antitoxin HicB
MNATLFAYPAMLEPDEDGRLLVRFPDFPEALTDGADEAEALSEAADCLSEALAARIEAGEEIPTPSRRTLKQHQVAPSLRIALKAALYRVMRERKATTADLARAIDVDHKEARRLLDPKELTKESRLEEALAVFGYRSVFGLYEAEPLGRAGRATGVPGAPGSRPIVARRAPKVEPA